MYSRYEILMEEYSKTLNIEALAMLDIAKKQILPAVITYSKELCDCINAKKMACDAINADAEIDLVKKISDLTAEMYDKINKLDEKVAQVKEISDTTKLAVFYNKEVLPVMNELRAVADELEIMVAKKVWPFPTYGDLIFSIK